MKNLLSVLFLSLICNLAPVYGQTKGEITIKTNSNDCEIFIDGVKKGHGKSLKIIVDSQKMFSQIKVERKGYLTENEVVYFKDKEIEVNVNRKIYKSESGITPIGIKDVSGDNFETDYFFYDYKEYRKNGFAQIDARCFTESGVSGFGENAGKNLLLGLSASGYIDTNSTLFNTGEHKCMVEISFNYARSFFYQIEKDCNSLSMQMQVGVKYDFKDQFGKKLYSFDRDAKSGTYYLNFINWGKLEYNEKTSYMDKLMQEAIVNTLHDEFLDSAVYVIFKDDEVLNASKLDELKLISSSTVADMKSALKATVTIKTNKGFGSGCVVSNDGYILTSYHVIADAPDSAIKVLTNKGDTLSCKVNRTSRVADLAILKTEKSFPFSFSLNNSSEIEVTDEVVAIGTPASMELSQTVSKGIVSGIRKGGNGLTLIQTDVSVSPGNSGGPLLRSPATFIGVVNSKISGGRAEGLGFCTPVSDVIARLKLKVN